MCTCTQVCAGAQGSQRHQCELSDVGEGQRPQTLSGEGHFSRALVERNRPCLLAYLPFPCYYSLTTSKFPSGLFFQLENVITLLDVQVTELLAQLSALKWSWWIFIFEGFPLVCGSWPCSNMADMSYSSLPLHGS